MTIGSFIRDSTALGGRGQPHCVFAPRAAPDVPFVPSNGWRYITGEHSSSYIAKIILRSRALFCTLPTTSPHLLHTPFCSLWLNRSGSGSVSIRRRHQQSRGAPSRLPHCHAACRAACRPLHPGACITTCIDNNNNNNSNNKKKIKRIFCYLNL